MQDEDGHFGEPVADRYDETSNAMFDPAVVEPAVDFLAGLAEGGRALELGVGTGRIALPLAARGVPVHGIDLSRAMVRASGPSPAGRGSRSPSATSRPPGSRDRFASPISSGTRS